MVEKNYDVWNEGFLGSGFEEESANCLRLASERAVCSVCRDAKKKGELVVSLCLRGESSGSKEIARCVLPDKAIDFFGFSVQLATGLFGTRRRYAQFGREVLPRDLADLVENAFDYLGDDSVKAAAPEEPKSEKPAIDDGFDALVARLSRVIGAAREASDEQILAATKAQDYEKGRKALESSTRLRSLQEQLDDFAAKWKAEGLTLPKTEGEGENDEENTGDDNGAKTPMPVEPISPEPEPELPAKKPGKRPPSVLAVTFPDGTRLAEDTAGKTFALAIEKIGAAKVAPLGKRYGDDPIVTRNAAEIKTMPKMRQEIADGWFVKTHSNTGAKKKALLEISDALGLSLKVEVLQKVKEDKPPRRRGRPPKNAAKSEPKRRRGRPPKNATKPSPGKKTMEDIKRDFKISRIVQWYFPKLFKEGKMTDSEVAYLASDASKRVFGTRGYPILKLDDGEHDRRYYADVRLPYKGKVYLLTSQFMTGNCGKILDWLAEKGCDRAEMDRIGCGKMSAPSLFDDLSLFDFAASGSGEGVAAVASSSSDSGAPSSDSLSTSSFNVALQEAMNRQNLSKGGLAKKLGVSRQDVRNWCKGYGEISRTNYSALCRALGVDSLA